MSRRVKEFVEIEDLASLDSLIDRLVELRDSLPAGAEPQLRMRGDDVFGRHLCVSYMRLQTAEEAACEARYADAVRLSRQRDMERLHDDLGFCPLPRLIEEKLRDAA